MLRSKRKAEENRSQAKLKELYIAVISCQSVVLFPSQTQQRAVPIARFLFRSPLLDFQLDLREVPSAQVVANALAHQNPGMQPGQEYGAACIGLSHRQCWSRLGGLSQLSKDSEEP